MLKSSSISFAYFWIAVHLPWARGTASLQSQRTHSITTVMIKLMDLCLFMLDAFVFDMHSFTRYSKMTFRDTPENVVLQPFLATPRPPLQLAKIHELSDPLCPVYCPHDVCVSEITKSFWYTGATHQKDQYSIWPDHRAMCYNGNLSEARPRHLLLPRAKTKLALGGATNVGSSSSAHGRC